MNDYTYHIYWHDKPIFKNLTEDEFEFIWERILSSYNDKINYVRLASDLELEESSY